MAQSRKLPRLRPGLLLGTSIVLAGSLAFAAAPKKSEGNLEDKAFFKPELYISSSQVPVEAALVEMENRATWESFYVERGEAPEAPRTRAFVDPRSGAATSLLESLPLLPGNGVGNALTRVQLSRRLGRQVAKVDASVVRDAARRHVEARRALLNVDTSQLGEARITQVNDQLWQVNIPQSYAGIPVRYGRVAMSISHGNVVVMGTETWGDVQGLIPIPTLAADAALSAGFEYAGGRTEDDEILTAPTLEIVPTAPPEHQHGDGFAGPVGAGYRHRLVWTLVFRRAPEFARWEVMIDAHSGEILSFQDLNHYEAKQVKGGVYPVTATGVCPNAAQCGTMQTGWPMPFADTGLAAPNNFTNSGGVFDYPGGSVTTTLTGQFVDIVDSCGAISESSGTGDLNLGGANNQHDCTSAGASLGDTPASRTAFYEVNKLAEQARGWLPSNTWLQSRLTTNVNLAQTCNAFWNGVSINFYRSGGGCRNTGELAGVFDHEWGHGLDDNDAAGALSSSSEAYADIAAIYRLQASCVGHGFFQTIDDGCGQTIDGTGFNVNESQTGTHCVTDCSGVRDSDYLKHADGQPDTALGFVCTHCTTGTGPCGRQVHCSAAPVRQAAWDLVARDLQAAPFSYDSQRAFMIGNRLFYLGSGNIGSWHACTCGSSSNGCGSTNGYMQWLTADDDNGNLNDGTPHMTAIFNAFNRHGIACSTPTPQNGGCAGGPTAAPTLTLTPGNNQVALSWTAVTGASSYWVFRTEGQAGCNFGKTRIATVTGTSHTDTQVANGRTYHYNVVAAGSSSSCFGAMSTCQSATPAAPTNPDFTIACSPSSLTVTQGTSATSTCTVSSSNGFSSAVSLSCTGMPAGSTCSFSPASVTPPANGSANSTLTVAASTTAATGTFSFNAQGVSGALTHSFGMGLTVNPAGGGGDLIASFDTTLQAPKCATVGSSCDTGPSLVLGRASLGPEPNQPNTINDSCADGISGTFHSDESNDRIKVSTTDGTPFAPGKTVRIDATVWAWTTPSSDKLDLFFAANASSPSWTLITTLTPTVVGSQVLSATYTLPSGALQAVRAQFRFQSTNAACSAGDFNDRDDLVFAVNSPPVTTVFEDDFETDKGWIRNPNGTDTATLGLWERGDPQQTSSSGVKQLGTTVSGVNDLVTARLAGATAGANDVDGGVTRIQSPAIVLPATGTLTLTFQYYLAHGSNSSSADFFRVYVVNGATSTQVFQSLGAAVNRNGAWTPVSVSLGSFAGQTIRLRIEAADVSTASLVEAGVDDVKITQQ